MHQQGQTIQLKSNTPAGERLWAYRYRVDGRDSRRVQQGGFTTQHDAQVALDVVLERLRRQRGAPRVLTLAQLVEEYLDQHQAEPETTEKLRWLLTKSVRAFGDYELHQLQSREIAAWRMRIPAGHRFEATQALRQVLARAIEWRLIDFNAAKTGVANPVPTRREMRPFETWDDLRLLADVIGPRYGPVVLFAAATGLRPCEWLALEHRDIDLQRRAVHVRRNYVHGRVKTTKTVGSLRTVPLQDIAMRALEQMPSGGPNDLLIPAPEGGHFDLHNFRTRIWNPGQEEALVHPGGASTICGTPSPRSPSPPASRPSTCPGTWERA